MERALLQGELTAQLEKILQDEKWIEQLEQKDQKLAAELEEFRFEEGAKIQTSKSKMETIELELNKYYLDFFWLRRQYADFPTFCLNLIDWKRNVTHSVGQRTKKRRCWKKSNYNTSF